MDVNRKGTFGRGIGSLFKERKPCCRKAARERGSMAVWWCGLVKGMGNGRWEPEVEM